MNDNELLDLIDNANIKEMQDIVDTYKAMKSHQEQIERLHVKRKQIKNEIQTYTEHVITCRHELLRILRKYFEDEK